MSPLPIQSDPGKHALMEPVPLYEEEKQIRANNLSVGAPLDAREAEKYEDTFSAGAIFRGEAGHNVPTTPFELKAALINAELDKMGLGRYQKCIWLLCGFGYFVDLLWAQAVGLMAISIYQEMDVPDDKTGLIFTANSAGLTIGAFTFGLLVDIIGRKWAFNTTVLITCFFGTMLAAVKNNYNAICAVTALCGFGLGGQIPIDATITLEYLPQNRRYLLSLLSMWQPIGVVIASAICYGTVPKWRCPTTEPPLESCMVVADGEPCCSISSNYGWRVAAGVLGGITLLIFFARVLFFKFHESPKYLLGRGREAEAIEVLHKIAAFNRQDPPALTLEHFAEIDQRQSVISDPVSTTPLTTAQTSKKVLSEFVRRTKHLKGLFASKLMIFTSMILIIAYIGDFWSFNLAGSYLPIILQRRNVSSGQGTVTDTYRQYVYIYLPGIIGAIMAMFFVQLPVIGRKWSLVFGAAMQGLAMAMYTQVGTTAGYVGLNAMEYIFQTFFNAILYATTPELFPAYVRGSASGLLSTCGRLSGIVAPFAAQNLLASKSSGILWLATGGIWVSMLALVFLPIETRKRASY